jgi:mRNA interferase MazF
MAMVTKIERFSVCLVDLDPSRGSEIKKTRPCLVISPDEMNHHIRTIIIAPMTSAQKNYPTRIPVRFQGKNGQIALDQLRTIDKSRIIKVVGKITAKTAEKVCAALLEMFAY